MYQFGNIDVKKVLVIRVLSVLGRREAGVPRGIRTPGLQIRSLTQSGDTTMTPSIKKSKSYARKFR